MKINDPKFQAILKEPIVANGEQDSENSAVSNRTKTFFKRWPRLYNFLKKTIGPSNSLGNRYNLKNRIHKIFGDTISGKVILNLGSGTNRIHPEIINVDLFTFKEVDVVADICDMPFKDSSVDGIVCEDVLEHVAQAFGLLKEMSRVLKPAGMLIIKVPFVYPYHSSPNDFFRWTDAGLRHVLIENNFSVKESGITGGPMCTLQAILMHIFAMLFSFGSKNAYFILIQFFMVVFSPLKLLDPLFMLSPFAMDIASHIFIITQKNK